MNFKTALVLVALATPAFAYEPVTCAKNSTQNIITSITSSTDFCTMLTGYGVTPVAPNEGCASVYCYGPSKLGPPMPKGYILSANYAINTTFVQITGCIDSAVWGQNPLDDGGQMDSHGWPYSCQGYKKFVSLIEPATNTFCIRCCANDDNVDCNTSVSTKGCWNVVPGAYTMADGSTCKPPAGAANSTLTPTLPTASGATPGVPTGTGPGKGGAGSGSGSGTGGGGTQPSAGFKALVPLVEPLGALAAAALVTVAAVFVNM